jgi:protein-tyrosine phosphatase
MRYSQITPSIYLGGQYSLKSVKVLKKRGVTAVVNMRINSIHKIVDEDISWLKILHLPTVDLTAPSIDNLNKGIKFIQKELEVGGKVYVHCRQGEGRGPTMVLAYLISTGILLEDALAEVQKVRSFAKPTEEQMKQLRLLEKQRSQDFI